MSCLRPLAAKGKKSEGFSKSMWGNDLDLPFAAKIPSFLQQKSRQKQDRPWQHSPRAGLHPAVDSVPRRGWVLGMVTQKTKYALKALLLLAARAKNAPEALTIEGIAKRSGAPQRFLGHIVLKLRNAGIILSTRGRAGGSTDQTAG